MRKAPSANGRCRCATDDYCWRYGDGPKLAVDALLERWGADVARSYVAGDCLCIQRA